MGKKTAASSTTKKTEKKTEKKEEKKEEKKVEKKVTATPTPATPSTPSTPANTPATTEKSDKEKSKKLAVKRTVGKKVRDPDAPKRSLSPYFHFSAKRRPELKAAHPGTSFGDLTKMVAAEWNSMQDVEKKQFNDLAAADKTRYENEKASYDAKSKQ